MVRLLSRLFTGIALAALCLGPVDSLHAASSSSSKSGKSKTASKSTSKKKSTPKRAPKAEPTMRPILTGNGVPQTNAASVFLADAITGKPLYQKNADERRAPASTQKLLTALLVAEEGNLDQKVIIKHADTLAEPVKLYLKPGDVYTRRELLRALLVKSFNDVARALARDNAGSVEAFAVKMNRRAAELGMTNSRFVNPNGLTEPGQYSTARDMARLARAAYANPTLRDIFSIKLLTFRHANGKVQQYKNTNRVLRGWEPCNGMKTGYTMAAGHCLVSSAEREGREVIAVLLGDDRRVWQDSCSILAWGLKM